MTNSIDELAHCDAMLIIGSNTTENHPIVALRIKEAADRGCRLIVCDPRKIPLVRDAALWLRQRVGTDVALLSGLMHVIIKEGLHDKEFIGERTEGFEALEKTVEKYTPEYVSGITGIAAEAIVEAARIYAGAERASIVYAMGITQHVTGTDNVKSLANLAMLCGNLGRESTGVNPLRGQNNVQGACDMGGLPNVYPGYQKVDDEKAREKFEKAWSAKLSPKPGLTLTEMLKAAGEGRVKALYVVGENPMLSDPDITHVEESLRKLDFLVVQDIFLTETARLADVVLPGTTFAERKGTYTNTERRVQIGYEVVPPLGGARPDWEIISAIAKRMGYSMDYASVADVMKEIASVTPQYGGISYERLEAGEQLVWPCPDAKHPGTRFLHKGKFTRGRGLFHAIEFRPPDELPDVKYPMVLTTGRVLYHFHTSTMTGKTKGLRELFPDPIVEINPEDARALKIGEGDMVRVSTRRGHVTIRAEITERVERGTIFIPFHFCEAAAHVLTNTALDPVAKIPELKACAASVERIQ